jgi:predicted dehydrogenase
LKKIQCAVIGCGRIGCSFDDFPNNKTIETHAGSYFKNSKTNLVALCDIDESKLKQYGKKFSVSELFTNPDDLFKNVPLDCISICTHADTHLSIVRSAVNHGIKTIFLEKPISNSLKNSFEILKICKKNNVLLLIDHQRRFDPFFINLRNFVNTKLGKIQMINITYGGGIVNTGTHIIDLLRYFFGNIDYVDAKNSENFSGNLLDPNIDAKIVFKNKIICFLHALDLSNFGFLEMQIFGSQAVLRIDLTNNEISYFEISKKSNLAYKNLEQKSIHIKNSTKSGIFLGVENLINSINHASKPKCTGLDGYNSLEGVISLIKSAKLRTKIKLPLKKTNYTINSK